MTTPVPPAEEAVQAAATTALPTDAPIDPSYFVPQATRDNYLTIIRDQAAVRNSSPDQVRDELVTQFALLHERQPLDGYDHLSNWLAAADLSTLSGPTGMQVLTARTLESARRDPYQAVIGDQALVEQGVAAQLRADETAAAAAVAPAVDPSLGFLPNSGPLPAPTDTSGAVDPAVAEQQRAAAEQTDASGNLTEDAAAAAPTGGAEVQSAPAESSSPAPADTTTSGGGSGSGSGGGHGKSGKSGSGDSSS